jgi:membrane associated rhomboid family serine protease
MVVILQRRIHPIIAGLIGLTFLTSIAVALDARSGGDLAGRLALVPMKIWAGELWRLVTWAFVERAPLALIYACVTLFWFAGDLVVRWGRRRFAWFVVAVVVGSAVATTVLALVLDDAWWFPHLGGMTLGSALVIAWALQFPDSRIRVFHGLLVIGGPPLAYGTAAVFALFAVFYGVAWVMPELIAACGTLIYMNGMHRDLWKRVRRLRRRKLGVRPGDRHGGPYGPN